MLTYLIDFCFYRDRDRNRHSNRDKDKHHDKKKSPKEEEKKEEPKVKPEVVEKKIAEILASSGALEVSKINQTMVTESKNESIEIVQDDFNEPADIDIPGIAFYNYVSMTSDFDHLHWKFHFNFGFI